MELFLLLSFGEDGREDYDCSSLGNRRENMENKRNKMKIMTR
jgi:hypothetical protein